MDEKVIIKGEFQKINLPTIVLGIAAIIFLGIWVDMLNSGDKNVMLWFFIALPLVVATVIVYIASTRCEITVTDKRIYGKVMLGKQVDLPFDSINAVAITSILTQGISASTASGRITFFYLSNRTEIYDSIHTLLMERQNLARKAPIIMQDSSPSNADELKKFKELLDQGIITQEEFDAKKKELLGL